LDNCPWVAAVWATAWLNWPNRAMAAMVNNNFCILKIMFGENICTIKIPSQEGGKQEKRAVSLEDLRRKDCKYTVYL
jgi:hypothetical protein